MAYLGNTPELQNFAAGADRFSGDASTTVFTLNRRVTSANDVIAYIESVPQDPFSAYTISANTVSGTADVTFTSAPPSGANNIVVNYRATQIVSYNSVNNSQIVSVANTKITGNIISSQITSVANTQITGNIISSQITSVANTQITGVMTAAQLANTAITPGTYGSASNISVITVDQQGRLTSASNVSISIPSGAFATNSNNSIFVANTNITDNVTISSSTGALSIGPVTIANGKTVTVSANARYVVL